MSQEQVLKTFLGLGLTRLDSQVYIYLAKKGPQKGRDLLKKIRIQRQQLYRSLKILQSKGIVSATFEHPAGFSAISFDKVVDLFIKSKMVEAQTYTGEKRRDSIKLEIYCFGGRPIQNQSLQLSKEEDTFTPKFYRW